MTKNGACRRIMTIHFSNFLFWKVPRQDSRGKQSLINVKITAKHSVDLTQKLLLIMERKILNGFLLMLALSAIASKLPRQSKMLKSFWRFKKNSALLMPIFGNLSAGSR